MPDTITPDEVVELQRCNSNLGRALELATTWRGRDSTVIAESLLDMVIETLDLDLVYLRLDEAAHSFVRIKATLSLGIQPEEVSDMLASWSGTEPRQWPTHITIGGVTLSITVSQLGINAGIGLLVAGARREGFPRQTERLFLTVASGQATIAFREVRQLSNRPLPRDTSYRQLTLEALTESERKIKLLLDTIPVTAWCTTADGMAEFFNQHHLDYVGRTSEELVGLGFLSQFHPDDLPRLLRTWQEMLKSKCGGDLEGRVRRADGEYRWTLMRTNPLLDTNGDVVRWYGVNTDIEDRKRAEDSLRAAQKALTASERNLNLIIDSLPVLVWASRTDGSADFVNDRYLAYVGLPADELLDWGYLKVFHPDDRAANLDRWKEQLSADTATNIVRIRRFDEVYRWFYLSGQKFTDATGNVRWFGVALDIEDLKRAEDALRESEAALQASERRLRELISTIPGLAWSSDADGEVTFVNKHYLEYTGLVVEEALGRGWATTIHPEDSRSLLLAWQAMRDAGKGGDYEARLRRADGQFRWFLFRTNPLYDDAGTLTQWFGVNIDIDDRKRAEENLRQSQAELARMTRIMTIGELAVSIAHEVNQPLMAIVTNAATCMRWLSNGQLDIPQAQKAVERIERDGLRAGEIIASIRGLARKSLPRMERMNIAYTVQEVLNLMHGEIHRRDIDVAAIVSEDAPEVIGDRIQLQQVVLNLIMNSVEAMATPALGSRRLAIDIFAGSDGYAQVVISDSGTGLDPVAGDRVFDAFFTTKQNGMGMGLSICRSIIEAHGGRIWVSKNTPSGSKFHFTVPLAAGIGSNDKTP